jgi:hypothetical protein
MDMENTEDRARFADAMLAIAEDHLAQQDRADWLSYGFLPSTRRLYALWRAQENCSFGEPERDRRDYLIAVLGQAKQETRQRLTERQVTLAGWDAICRGAEQGVDSDHLLRLGKEFGLDREGEGGTVGPDEELFENERLVPEEKNPDAARYTRREMLLAEARAGMQLEGIPEEEITPEALSCYAFAHESAEDRAARGVPSDEDFTEDFFVALTALEHETVRREHGEPPLPLGMDEDPKRAQHILWIKQLLRRYEETDAYWNDDHRGADEPGGDA